MNTFGTIFKVSVFGESHGEEIGAVIDGVEPGIPLSEADFKSDIDRRRSGALGTTPRTEEDNPLIVSGVYNGHTTGAPLTILFRNENRRSSDYSRFISVPRPGHSDFTAAVKYEGFNDPRGGGHFSGRLTLPVVAAGVVAKKVLSETVEAECSCGCRFEDSAELVEVGGERDKSLWEGLLKQAASEGDSLGGVVECRISGLPAGLGEPFWDSVESRISHAVFAIPGVRGIEFGDGFASSRMKGSEHNDPFGMPDHDCGEEACHQRVKTLRNGAGGVNGGITNGMPIVFRVAFKPTSSISRPQNTWDFEKGEMTELRATGRHDVCFALRTPVIVEAMAAIALADLIDM